MTSLLRPLPLTARTSSWSGRTTAAATTLTSTGRWVAPAGTVFDEGGLSGRTGNQTNLALARGTGSQLFLVYQGWAGTVGDKTYNTDRIWGDMNPTTGLGSRRAASRRLVGHRARATVVRGVLFLPAASGVKPKAQSLLDITGRKVMDLHPGANDVGRWRRASTLFVKSRKPQASSRKQLTGSW